MKTLLLGLAIAAALIAGVPALRNAGHHDAAAEQLPAPATVQTYRSPLGGHGGLGNASLAESEAGRIQVYTVANLPGIRDGQVVRLRFSRARSESAQNDDNSYVVSIHDLDIGGGVGVLFPAEGARKLDLIQGHSHHGLTFYVALEPNGLRAVGQVWKADTKAYTW